MRGLTIIVVGPEPDRFDAALTLASASAALGARTRLYAEARAVPLLARSGAHAAAIAEAQSLGAEAIACQTGLADARLTAPDLVDGVEMGGMVSLLASLQEDRLIAI